MFTRDPLDTDTPMFFILRMLRDLKWRSARHAPKQHTLDSDRVFAQVHQCVAKRAYLQCLTIFETLQQNGLEALPSGEQQGYYKAVLASKFPATVKMSQKADYYKALLKQDNEDSDCSEDNADSDNAEEGSRPSAKRVCTPTRSTADPTSIRAEALPSTEADPRTSDADPVTIDAEAAVSEAFVSDVATGLADEDDVIIRDIAHWKPMDIAYGVTLESRFSPGEAGHYRRLRLTCTLSHCLHSGPRLCNKSRNLTNIGNFGEREPEAYLIAWADAAPKFATRDSHMSYCPSMAEVAAVLQRHSSIAA